jgi:hypothetical protein
MRSRVAVLAALVLTVLSACTSATAPRQDCGGGGMTSGSSGVCQ